jgi:DNA-binding HxlR family transcriptional regulator
MTVDASVCPIVATMKMLGNQWNMIAIRYLHDEPLKFNQLRRAMGNVSSKTLSRSLKHLVNEEIVERRVLETSPISVEYSLTRRGRELSDALYGMKSWGKRWLTPSIQVTNPIQTTDRKGIEVFHRS